MSPLVTVFASAAFVIAIVVIRQFVNVVARLRRDLSENAHQLTLQQNQNCQLLQDNGVLQRKAEAVQKEFDATTLELTEANSLIARHEDQNRRLLHENGVLQRKAEALQKELDGMALELTVANSEIAHEKDQNRQLSHNNGVLQRNAEALRRELDGTTVGLAEANRRIAVFKNMKQELVVAEWHWKYHESMNEYWHTEAVRFRSRADKLSQAASEERSKELKHKLIESALTHGVALAV